MNLISTLCFIVMLQIITYTWVGLVNLRKQIKKEAINDIAKATGLPKIKFVSPGWFDVTCNSCGHIYLWYDEDICECTRCGKSYRQETVDEFKRPPEDWEPS